MSVTAGRPPAICWWRLLLSLGLMAKPTVVTLPPLLLLLDYWPLGRFGRGGRSAAQALAADRPGLGLAGGRKTAAGGRFRPALRDDAVDPRQAADRSAWSMRIPGPPIACVAYLAAFFFPAGLAVFYPYPAGG